MLSELFPAVFFSFVALAMASALSGRFRPLVTWTAWACFMFSMVMSMLILAEGGDGAWSMSFLSLGTPWRELQAGLSLNAAGVAAAVLLGAVLGYVFLIEPATSGRKGVADSRAGAAALGVAAVSIAWFADGLWGILLGQVLAALPGWTILRASPGEAAQTATLTTAFSRERALGWVFSALGFSALAAAGVGLGWNASEGFSAGSAPMGLGLLFVGAILQLRLFPALGWAPRLSASHDVQPSALALASSPPAWAAFALLYRMQPDLASSGLAPFLVVPTLLVSALTAWFSLSSTAPAARVHGLAGAAAGISVALLLLSGGTEGATAFLGFELLGWATVLILGSKTVGEKGFEWFEKVHRGALVLAWAGGAGFFSGTVLFGALSTTERPWEGALLALAWCMMALAAIGLVARPQTGGGAVGDASGRSWNLISSAVLAALSSSLLWSGSFHGAFAPDSLQAIGPAVALEIFSGPAPSGSTTLGLVHWAWTLVLLLVCVFRLPARIAESSALRWGVAGEGFRLAEFSGRAVDRLCRAYFIVAGLAKKRLATRAAAAPEAWLATFSARVSSLDHGVRERLDHVLRILVDAPAKAVQLMHSGAMQLYLLFAVGFSLALLLHFWGRIQA